MSFRATKKSKNESYLDIDLKELFGKDVPDSSAFRQAVGQEIIDTIVERTQKSKFLAPAKQTYDDDYVESVEFAAFGKSKNKVNLTQSGDMLGLMDIIKEKGSTIRIGWDDDLENKKATNINFGISKGMPKREFLGLTDKEEKKIREKFERDLPQPDPRPTSSVDRLTAFLSGEFGLERGDTGESFISRLFGSGGGDDG